MDPTTALQNLLIALDTEQRDKAIEYAQALADWLQSGGFYPEIRKAIDCACLPGVHVHTDY